MKRNPHLHPFSWDHHHGLVFARELKDALHQSAVEQLAARLDDFWRRQLLPHFHAEEELLFPLARKRGCAQEIERALAEHEHLTQLQSEIVNTQNNGRRRKQLAQFANLLVEHIRFEEGQLFPKLETALTPDELASVAQALAERASAVQQQSREEQR